MGNKTKFWHIKRAITAVLIVLFLVGFCFVTQGFAAENEASLMQIVEVGIPVEEHPELFLPRSMPTHGEAKIAVFLIQFPDFPNDNPIATREYYDKLYFTGGVETNWGNMTVAEYYKEQSYGKLNISGQVFDWYTAKHERSYYDNRKAELIMETAEYYRAQGTDFAQFDGNGDGVIDAVTYHFAGTQEYSPAQPWYHGVCYHGGTSGFGKIGDMKLVTMVQLYEDASAEENDLLRVVCHELGHALGMFDLYAENLPTGFFDLMSGHDIQINPYSKMLLGWIDHVQVITDDAKRLQLKVDSAYSPGDVVIVTNEYHGLFDEFFLVYYSRDEGLSNVSIWHIDARLNESGTAFLYNNFNYDPRPDIDKDHTTGQEDVSIFPFIEQIYADPTCDCWMNSPGNVSQTFFGEDSVLGPNQLPSSDTHDGAYTGIRIDNFKEYYEQHVTFDVSFEADTFAPVLKTDVNDLGIQNKIKLQFNENIYAGENWNQLQVLDVDGNPVDIEALLPNFPHNNLELTFKTENYQKGYKIVFPENCLCDSSGNGFEAITLVVSAERVFSPTTAQQLPDPGYNRNNEEAFFFSQNDGMMVITTLWESNIGDAKLELMRLDQKGHVLQQTVVDNPFENYGVSRIYKAGEDSYIVFYIRYGELYIDKMLCLDGEGNICWINVDFDGSDWEFVPWECFGRKDGLGVVAWNRVTNTRKIVHINATTGAIEDAIVEMQGEMVNAIRVFSTDYGMHFVDLGDGRVLSRRSSHERGDKVYESYAVIDVETYASQGTVKFPFDPEAKGIVQAAHVNRTGTILVVADSSSRNGIATIFLLDQELNIVQSTTLEADISSPVQSSRCGVNFLDDGGLVVVHKTEVISHDNRRYHIQRYDKVLDLLWKADLEANFVYYFLDSNGEMLAYRSMWNPERECYIDLYGSEEGFKKPHEHNLLQKGSITPTCSKPGRMGYWKCVECGECFLDEGKTILLDMQVLVLPQKDHQVIEIPAKEPTCDKNGYTAYSQCSECSAYIDRPETIPATGVHSFGEWSVDRPSTCREDGLEQRQCFCGETESRVLSMIDHTYSAWSVTKEATRTEAGEETRTCACGETETREIPALGGVNHVVIVVAAVAGLGAVAAVVIILLKKKK